MQFIFYIVLLLVIYPLHLCAWFFFGCKGSGFSVICGVNIDFLGYELFRIWVKTIGFATISVKITLNELRLRFQNGCFFICISCVVKMRDVCYVQQKSLNEPL